MQASQQQKSTAPKSEVSLNSQDSPIPITVVTKVDSESSHGEIPGTDAYRIRQADAKPDLVEQVADAPSKSKFCYLFPLASD